MGRSGPHEPVLLAEVVTGLAPRAGASLVDGTLGAGGHAEALLEAVGPTGCVVGIDRDPHALALASAHLERFGNAFVPLCGDHAEFVSLLHEANVFAVDGVLFDLGVSSMQLDDAERGFSFLHDGPLDMRMDPQRGQSAARLLAEIDELELRRVLWSWGEEREAREIARAIVRRREERPIERTGDLAAIVERAVGPAARRYRIHPATRTFQALRIAVNGEVVGLERLVTDAVSLLRRGGRIAVISYHSLEDRAVKHTLRALAHRCTCPPRMPVCGCGRENLLRVLTTRAVRPTAAEVAGNPRARSARLRVGERL